MMWMTLAIPTKYYVKKTTVIGRITHNVLFSRLLLFIGVIAFELYITVYAKIHISIHSIY